MNDIRPQQPVYYLRPSKIPAADKTPHAVFGADITSKTLTRRTAELSMPEANIEAIRANFLTRRLSSSAQLPENHLKGTLTLTSNRQVSTTESESETDSDGKTKKGGKKSSSSSSTETESTSKGQSFEERVVLKNAFINLKEPMFIQLTDGSTRPFKLTDIDLAGYDNRNAILKGLKLDAINLSESSMQDSILGGVSMNNANMTNARWERIQIAGSYFDRSIFTAALLDGSTIAGSQFQEADFSGARLRNGVQIQNCNLGKARFFMSEITDAKIMGSNLEQASLNEATLTRTNLSGSSLAGSDLNGTKFIGCNLSNVDLRKSRNLKTAEFKNCYYLEGYEPLFSDGVSADRLGIQKRRNALLVHPETQRNQNAPNESLFSIKSLAQLSKTDPVVVRLIQLLATPSQTSIPLSLSPQTIRTFDNALYQMKESFREGGAVDDYYTPSAKDPGETKEFVPLDLDGFILKTKHGEQFPDIKMLKEICLAQQLYSKYSKSKDQFWKDRLVNLFKDDYLSERSALVEPTQRSSEVESSESFFRRTGKILANKVSNVFEEDHSKTVNPTEIIQWVKNRFHLYDDPEFDFSRVLKQAGALDTESEPVGLARVQGYDDTKKYLIERIIAPLVFPMLSPIGSSQIIPGWVFHGVPGVGKSFTAKQLANQIGLKPVTIDLGSIGSAYENQTVRNLYMKFETAKRLSEKHGGAVILLDELDQLGSDRNSGEKTVNKRADLTDNLLTAITRYIEENPECRIICIGTTNYLSQLDKALTRPGRLGEHLEIPEPDESSRRSLLEFKLPDYQHLTGYDPYESSRKTMIEYIVDKTDGFSTAAIIDLANRLTGGYNAQITRKRVDDHLDVLREQRKLQ